MLKFYPELLENLQMKITTEHGSVKKFAEETGISRYNLSKVFTGKQDISVSLYLRICEALNVLPPLDNAINNGCTLRDYLSVDHDRLIESVLKLMTE